MNYTINITKIRKDELSTIVVWLPEPDENPLLSINTYDLMYAVICYRDYTTHALYLYEGDEETVSTKLINQFKANFGSVTEKIIARTSIDTKVEMMDTVEIFIRGYVYQLRKDIGFMIR